MGCEKDRGSMIVDDKKTGNDSHRAEVLDLSVYYEIKTISHYSKKGQRLLVLPSRSHVIP
jgi:hypothetical protein